MTSMRDFEALDQMFAEQAKKADEPPLRQARTEYGRDGPSTVVGPSPGAIGPAKKAPPKKAAAAKKAADPNEIWSEAEVRDAGDVEDVDDGRTVPDYDIVYSQCQTPEDMFLGVDPVRHPGISCSDQILLKVQLPGAKLAEIDLDVRPTMVRLGTSKYKLRAALAERVDDTKGNAKWDADKSTLTVSLPIIHDIDSKFQTSKADELD